MPATTLYKGKIGAHLSYPCTLSELNRHLAPASDHHALEVRFSTWRAPRPNATREEYALVEAGYSRRYRGEQAGEWHYEISVYAVPRTLRSHIRALLIPVATDRLRDWLMASHPPIWYTSPHRLRVRFDSRSDELSFHER